MNKLFKLVQVKGKYHKILNPDLGGGAKLYKNFAQKLLAVTLCAAVSLLGVPQITGNKIVAAQNNFKKKSIQISKESSNIIDESNQLCNAASKLIEGISETSISLASVLTATESFGTAVTSADFKESGEKIQASAAALHSYPDNFADFAKTLGDIMEPVELSVFNLSAAVNKLNDFSDDVEGTFNEMLQATTDLSSHLFTVESSINLFLSSFPGLITSVDYLQKQINTFVDELDDEGSASLKALKEGAISLSNGLAALQDTFSQFSSAFDKFSSGVCDVSLGLVRLSEDVTQLFSSLKSNFESVVTVRGMLQRVRLEDPNGILHKGTRLIVNPVVRHKHIDDTHEIEHLLAYNIFLVNAFGKELSMPLSGTVELYFEVLDGLDKDELEVVLVQEFDDAEFEENLVDLDGASWVKVKTDHFSPYVLIDRLSPGEKAARNVPTGDQAAQMTVVGLGMVLVLALGVMLRLITRTRKFED